MSESVDKQDAGGASDSTVLLGDLGSDPRRREESLEIKRAYGVVIALKRCLECLREPIGEPHRIPQLSDTMERRIENIRGWMKELGNSADNISA